MPLINKKLENCIDRVDKIINDFEEGKITEIGLMDFLDTEIQQFTKRSITWSNMRLEDYFEVQFCAQDRILMMYVDIRFDDLEMEFAMEGRNES